MTSRRERDHQEGILRVLVRLRQNLDAALDLEDPGRITGDSPFLFHRVFRRMVGESVAHHVRRLRLERAAMRRKHTKRSITSLAFEAGYESHEAFTRAFHKAFGLAPRDFRASGLPSFRLGGEDRVHFLAAEGPGALRRPGREKQAMNVERRAIPPMRVAFLRHVGPCGGLDRTDAWPLGQWFPGSRHEPGDAPPSRSTGTIPNPPNRRSCSRTCAWRFDPDTTAASPEARRWRTHRKRSSI